MHIVKREADKLPLFLHTNGNLLLIPVCNMMHFSTANDGFSATGWHYMHELLLRQAEYLH